MKIGDIIHGFELISITPVEEIDSNFHLFRHQQTGAQLLWTGREDSNKTFSVAFQTIPEDDTGVFHILEHSVLCGSDKYPVKEPFVELMKGSMNTFLNAMTFPHMTVYPVSSRNDADFRNLMGIYLDAVFCPAIYHNENIFMQEGWHFETDEQGNDPRYVGVVYGEMKGAFSSVDEIIGTSLNQMLYPDTSYRYVSGGDPAHIPELTYEKFLNTHARFYSASNARFFLDGSVDLEQALEDIQEGYLKNAQRRELDFGITMQKPIPYTEKTVEYEVNPGEDGENQAHFSMARVIGTWEDAEKMLAIRLLSDYLTGSNDAPLKRAALEAGLGQEIQMSIMDGVAQPCVDLEVRNTSAEKLPGMKDALQNIVRDILAKGLDRHELIACLNQMEFRVRERPEPFGVYTNIDTLQSWIFGGDPSLYLHTNRLFAFLREKLDTGYYEDLLKELFLGDEGLAVVYALPSQTLGEKNLAAEQARANQAAQHWTAEEKAEIMQKTAALQQWQKTPDSPEALATIPHISISDISPEPYWIDAQESQIDGVRVIRPEVNTNGTVYLQLYFAVPGIGTEDIAPLNFLTSLLGSLPTKRHSSRELQREIKTDLGSLSFGLTFLSQVGDLDHCEPALYASCSVLESNVDKAVEMIREILQETELDHCDKIQEILQQSILGMQQSMVAAGHQYALYRAMSGLSAENAVTEKSSGYDFYTWMRNLAGDFQSACPALLEKMQAYLSTLTRGQLTIGVTGKVSNDSLSALCHSFPEAEHSDAVITITEHGPCRESIAVPAGVAYAVTADNVSLAGGAYHGSMQLMAKVMSLSYLWNEVRVQGGAYGAGMSVRGSGALFCYSYRDPNPSRTLEVYRRGAEYLRQVCEEEQDLSQLIIGTVSDMEPLMSPRSQGAAAVEMRLRGITLERRRKERRELLDATHEQLLACCPILEHMAEHGSVCIVGGDALLDSCGADAGIRLH